MRSQPVNGERLLVHFFSREHEILKQFMECLKKLAYQDRLLNSQTIGEFRFTIDLLLERLKAHYALEEELLFEAMKDSLGYSAQPVIMMTEEHQRLLRQLDEMQAEVRECDCDGHRAERLRDVTNTMNRLLHDHFHKEEKLLFPMAEHILSKEKKAKLIAALEEKWRETNQSTRS